MTKAAALAVIVGLLMLALGQISHLADEREARFREAERSVEQSQAGRQALLGPALLSHCVEEWETSVGEGKERKTQLDKREFMLSATPRQLAVQASATMEPRYRGLFKVNTYASRATLQAQWAPLAALRPQREHAGSTLRCAAPVLMVAVSDARGIRQAVVKLGGDALAVQSGTRHASHPRGFHAVLPEALRNGSTARHRSHARTGRHGRARGGADRRRHPHDARRELAASLVRRTLSAAHARGARRRIQRHLAAVVAGHHRRQRLPAWRRAVFAQWQRAGRRWRA
jgi:hypothetical protein